MSCPQIPESVFKTIPLLRIDYAIDEHVPRSQWMAMGMWMKLHVVGGLVYSPYSHEPPYSVGQHWRIERRPCNTQDIYTRRGSMDSQDLTPP